MLVATAGAAGFVTESITVTASIFIGIFGMWMVFTLPAYIQQAKGLKKETEKPTEKTATQKLPSPDEAMALIRKRRSIFPKDYNGQKVSKADVRQMLEAARWAPTHGLTEPWR